MRALIIISTIVVFMSAPVLSAVADPDVPDGLWEALARVGPNRSNAVVVAIHDDIAEVDGPIGPTSERLRSRPVYQCVASLVRWTCRIERTDFHIATHGKHHRIRALEVRDADVARIADYIYSPCFVQQYRALGGKARDPWGSYGLPISSIHHRDGGLFSVVASAQFQGMVFHIGPADARDANCEFQLRDITSFII